MLKTLAMHPAAEKINIQMSCMETDHKLKAGSSSVTMLNMLLRLLAFMMVLEARGISPSLFAGQNDQVQVSAAASLSMRFTFPKGLY